MSKTLVEKFGISVLSDLTLFRPPMFPVSGIRWWKMKNAIFLRETHTFTGNFIDSVLMGKNGNERLSHGLAPVVNPFPWSDPSLSGPGSELFTCLSAPPPGGGWRRGGTIPPPAALGSNGPITGAARLSVRGLVHSAQSVVRLVRERSAYPPGLWNVDYGCFDGQHKLDHTTELLQGGFKVPMETGRNLEHTTKRHQRGFKVPMETGSL